MIKKAREILPHSTFIAGDACALSFKNESFDCVLFSFNGIDYIFPESERLRALKEINRILKRKVYSFSARIIAGGFH